MGGTINLPTRNARGFTVVQIPQQIFGKRITIQAHDIAKVFRGRHICDGHECDQTTAKGDIAFFSAYVDISNL